MSAPTDPAPAHSRTLLKYTLLQIPDVVIVGLGLLALYEWLGLSRWIAISVFAVWLAKDVALYPVVRRAYEGGESDKVGVRRVLGARGVATQDLAPDGWVRVSGELWRAKSLVTDRPIERGAPVRVREVRGMTLLIEPDASDPE